jgi:hypothetical protein
MVVVRWLLSLWQALGRGLKGLLSHTHAAGQQPLGLSITSRTYIPVQPRFLEQPTEEPLSAPADEPLVVPAEAPQPRSNAIGESIGQGGQGAVYVLADDPRRVVKQFSRAIPGVEADFKELIAVGAKIREPLAGLPIDFCWPEDALIDSGLTGYIMPRLDSRYYFPYGNQGRSWLRTLDFAVPRASAFTFPFTVSDADRLVLVQLVAAFLESMHAAGVVYGDLSWGNFAFDPSPEPRLAVYDVDSSRILGSRSFTRQPPASTPDWDDPMAPDLPVATLDADRYKFALLAFRLLVARNLDGRIAPAQLAGSVPGFSALDSRQLAALWSRAAGPGGTRPQLSEWTRILGRPRPSGEVQRPQLAG